ncbi:hypothetical protein [Bradyrhizobium sp. USDA 3650]
MVSQTAAEWIIRAAQLVWLLLALWTVWLCVKTMNRRGHQTQINVIWYAFSLVFVIRITISVAAYLDGYSSLSLFLEQEMHIPSAYTLWLHDWLTNIRDELVLVISIIVVAVVPQLLTYGLAGIFGCAKPPALVWYFEELAAWILIKFLAALSAIVFEEAVSPIGFQAEAIGATPVSQIVQAALILMTAFGLGVLQTRLIDIVEGRSKASFSFAWAAWVRDQATRNLPKLPEPVSNDPGQH